MINFRYHIVSLMAVFLALAVGIAVGVTLSPSVQRGIATQAEQDRQQVIQLRAEIDRRNALDAYRDAYEQRVGTVATAGQLADTRVALVTMPDAPGAVTQELAGAVQRAGATVVANVKVADEVYDPARHDQVEAALQDFAEPLGLDDSMSVATKLGRVLARAVAAKSSGARDSYARRAGAALASAGLVNVREDTADTAQLLIVVTAKTTQPVTSASVLAAHVQTELALKEQDAVAVVLAGPNSGGIESTDVLTARSTARAEDLLSTVDVADLPSGVTTTVLAGREQVLGRQGHYGALARADAPLPSLPVR